MNGYVSGKFNRKNLLYINGHPHTHRNIAGFMNSSRCSFSFAKCSFEEHFNDEEFFMKRKASKFVVVHAIHSLSPGEDLLINYKFRIPSTTSQRHFALGLPLDIPLGSNKKKHLINCIC